MRWEGMRATVVPPFVFLLETPGEQFACRFPQELTLKSKSTLSVAPSLCVTRAKCTFKKSFCYVRDWCAPASSKLTVSGKDPCS